PDHVVSIRMGSAARPARSGVRSASPSGPTLVTQLPLALPKIRSPSNVEPNPHPSQKAAPVIAIVGLNHVCGRFLGAGPSWLVSSGLVPEQFSPGPHAKLPPFAIRLIS